MKEMIYKNREGNKSPEILHEEDIGGYKILIISMYSHPCAYIGFPKEHSLSGVSYSELGDSGIYGVVNGGFTYSGKANKELEKDFGDMWFIGWDYCHSEDYTIYWNEGKKWTTQEIYKECLEQLEQFKKIKVREPVTKYYVEE